MGQPSPPGSFAVQVVTGVVQGKADAPGLLRPGWPSWAPKKVMGTIGKA